MKMLTLFLCTVVTFTSCSNSTIQPKFYGETFDTTKVISVEELVSKMQGQTRVDAVVGGIVTESCQSEGCWLNLKNEGGSDVFVDWDHHFNTPKDLSGRRVIADGYAYVDTTKAEHVIAFKAAGVHL